MFDCPNNCKRIQRVNNDWNVFGTANVQYEQSIHCLWLKGKNTSWVNMIYFLFTFGRYVFFFIHFTKHGSFGVIEHRSSIDVYVCAHFALLQSAIIVPFSVSH